MNIDTNQLQQIVSIIQCIQGDNVKQSSMLQDYIGQYVICRSRNEGINTGYVKAIDETGVILSDARRLWFHKSSNNSSWYEGVANNGLSSDSKISEPAEKVIVEDYSLTICSNTAKESLLKAKSHEK